MSQKNSYPGSASQLTNSLHKNLLETLKNVGGRLNDHSAAGALARGQVFQLSGYYEDAVESYTEALALDPQLDEAAARLPIAQLLARHPAKALVSAMKLAERNPGFELKEMTSDQHQNAMTILGDALTFNERPKDAIEAYKVARTASKRDVFAAGRLAQLYLATGEPTKAVEQAKNVGNNPRFGNLARLLSLGQKNAALLPVSRAGAAIDMLSVTVHGRPLLVEGTARVAPLVWGDDQWCADLSEEVPAQ